jgi:putative ABC transport system permease protein
MSVLGLALRNLRRNRLRVALTVLAGALAIVAFVVLRTVVSAFHVWADNATPGRIVTRHRLAEEMGLPLRYLELVRAVPGVALANHGLVVRGRDPRRPRVSVAAVAVDAPSFLAVFDEIVLPDPARQRWLDNRSGAIVGDQLARALGVKAGDKLTLATGRASFELAVEGVYTVSRPTYGRRWLMFHYALHNETVPPEQRDRVRRIYVRVADPGRTTEVAQAIDAALASEAVPALTETEHAENAAVVSGFAAILVAVQVGSVAMAAIMILLLANTIAMGVRERRAEHATLFALGFDARFVSSLVVLEAMLVGALSAVAGLCLAYPFVNVLLRGWLEGGLGIVPHFRTAPITWAAALLVAVGSSVLAALVPALRAARTDVTVALRAVG